MSNYVEQNSVLNASLKMAIQEILKGSIVMGAYKGATAKLMLLLKIVKVCVVILGSV